MRVVQLYEECGCLLHTGHTSNYVELARKVTPRQIKLSKGLLMFHLADLRILDESLPPLVAT